MILIQDNDLPITAAQKIITGVKPNTSDALIKSSAKALTGNEEAGETMDMFSLDEIGEIADYLKVYCDAHKNGD